ncbi:MAG: aminoacyl-tRNA hydrolase [Lachnospiraceae bacterium]|nr:aminoacyl-tRNA hydrolase [Lachnospiraceae bacterium]
MRIIVGLGNPTLKYSKTRHNVGFETIDVLSKKHKIKVKKNQFKALIGEGFINDEKVILVKPMTYMNNSGVAVKEIVDYYKVNPNEDLIVISDDLNLDVGVLRLRSKGSAGGHNGLKSIIKCVGTESFDRVRIGVGKVPANRDVITHVLSRFGKEDRKIVKESFIVSAQAIECVITDGMEKAMSKFNGPINRL